MNSLSKREKHELILDLIRGFVLCKTLDDAVIFLEDLITKKELETLSKRLRIAKLLIEGFNYRQIQDTLHVSHGTIAKVSYWLSDRGEGFRKIVKMLPKRVQGKDPLEFSAWEDLKRKYPSYFLPELIVDSINADRKKKKEVKVKNLISALDNTLNQKRKVHEETNNLFKPHYKNSR